MRKKIFYLAIFFTFLLAVVSADVLAISSPSGSSRNPPTSSLGKLKSSKETEATERAKSLSNPQNPRATPPGLLRLRERIATAVGRISFLKTRVYIGTVSAILAGQTFTLSTKDGSRTVQTNEETRFIQGKFKDGLRATFESLRPEDRVIAVGQVNEEGLMTAKIVVIIPAKEKQIKRRAVYGVVEQKVATDAGTLLTLRHPKTNKTYEVLVNSQTKITGKGLTNATINDIQIGNRVAAVGTVDETGRITAKRLHVIPGLARGLFGTQPSTPSSRRPSPTPTPTIAPTATPTATPTP